MKRIYFKKVISIILTLCMLIPYVSNVEVMGGEKFTNGNLSYKIITEPQDGSNGRVSVEGNNKEVTSIVIPETITYNGFTYDVVKIRSFYGYKKLESIEIPDSITFITDSAFRDCSSLTSIKIPDAVTSIENYTFYNCSSLTNIEIHDTVTYIGSYAFSGCSSLTSIEIPDTITSIYGDVFSDCSSLTNIKIPSSVTYISSYAFSNCSNLTNIKIPSSVTYIGSYAFYNCTGLTDIEIPPFVTQIYEHTFDSCSSLTNIKIPNYITKINQYAFAYCNNLKNITILSTDLSIDSDYFGTSVFPSEAEKFYAVNEKIKKLLTNSKIPSDKIEIIDESLLYTLELNSDSNGTVLNSGIYMEGDKVSIKATPNNGYKFDGWTVDSNNIIFEDNTLTEVTFTMPAENVEITANFSTDEADYLLTSKPNLDVAGIVYGDGSYKAGETVAIKAIPNRGYKFKSWTVNSGNITVEDWYLPETSFIIGSKNVEITANFSEIKVGDTFVDGDLKYEIITLSQDGIHGTVNVGGNNRNATSIVIPKTVINNGDTYDVIEIEGGGSYNEKNRGFYKYENLKDIEIPDSITSISDSAFYGCSNLTNIELPNSITYMGSSAFSGCSSLASIKMPNSITYINYYMFSGCSSLTDIELPNSITYIGRSAFFGCSSLTDIELPNSITDISIYAFSGCSGLTNIELPNSITDISGYAFSDCNKLESITILFSDKTTLDEIAFKDINDNIKFYVIDENMKNKLINGNSISSDKIEIIDESLLHTLNLNLNSNDNGTVKGNGIYMEGNKVCIKAVPNNGYKFDGWRVDSNNVTFENNNLNEVTFTMPAEDVEITAVFLKDIKDYLLTLHSNSDVAGSVYGSGNYKAAETVTIKAIPNKGYKFDNWIINSGNITLEDKSFPEIEFIMPAEDVEITANFSKLSVGDSFVVDDLVYQIITTQQDKKNGTVNVRGKNTDIYSMVIPKTVTYNGTTYDVVVIKSGSNYFNYRYITSAEIPDSITSIDDYAFYNCAKLATIEIPDSVTYIGEGAFANCERLTSVKLSNLIDSIDVYAFKSCYKLTNIEIPDSVTYIGDSAFSDCRLLNNITILSANLKDLYPSTFINISTNAKFHVVNEDIKNLLINECKISEENIDIIDAPTLYDLKLNSNNNGTVYGGGKYAEGKTVTIKANANDEYKFDGWTVKSGNVTLEDNTLAQTTFVMPAEDVEITANFVGTNETIETDNKDLIFNIITKPEGETNGTVSVTVNNKNLTSVDIPETIKDKDGNTYTVVEIEDNAFKDCVNLQEIKLPSTITVIGQNAFDGCTILQIVIIISDNVTIGDDAFTNIADNVIFITTNDSVKDKLLPFVKDESQIQKPEGDIEAYYSVILKSDSNGTVKGNGIYKQGDTITIKAKAKDGYKFDSWTVNSGNVTLEDITLAQTTFIMPANDVEITANFVGTNEIVETDNKDLIFNIITKPEGETNGTVSVTVNNKNLTSVDIPETIKDKDGNTYTVVEIEDNAFKDCSNLQHIKLPNTIITIGQGAFENCTNLIEITIPSGVTSIGDNAFKGCIILQIVVIISVNITIGKDAFTNVSDNVIYITTNNDTKDKLKPFVKDENQIQVSDGNVKDTSSVIIRTSTGGTATGNGLYKSGDTVNLKATAKDGYKFDKWIVISGNIAIENINSEATSFTMPNKNVILMANFISNSGSSDNNVGDSFVTDDKFIVTVTKPAGSDTQGTVTIVGTTDTSDTITVPSTITDKNGKVYKITFVSDNAFTGNKNITSVIIQNGITSIGNGAFKDCINLIHISIPDSVTSIGDSAFENCTKLEKIEIPISVILIGNNAFKGCINLSKIIILTIKVIIKNNAFENISKDASFIVINQEIKNILIQIGIAESQIVISKGLHKVTVKSDSNGVVAGSGTYSKDDTVTIKATPNEKYKFDKWTVNAGNVTLADDKLAETTFTMPDEDVEVTASFIKDEIVIESNDNLDFIVQKPATENEEGEVTFKVIDKNVNSVTIPSKVKDNKGNSYVIKIIPNNAFEGCTNLKEIKIPETIISIGDSAFKGCTNLIKIILPDTITVIGSNAFEGCTSLIEITIPKNVELIKDNAFLNCTSLIKVIILSLNLQIATSAFTGMSSNTIFIVLNQEVKAILILCHILEIQIIILDPESNLQEQINKANELLRKSYPTLDEVIQSTIDLSDGIVNYFQSK